MDAYRRYEDIKRRLLALGLTPTQYQEIVRIIAELLGI